MVTGLYFLTTEIAGDTGEYARRQGSRRRPVCTAARRGRRWPSTAVCCSVRAKIKVRLTRACVRPPTSRPRCSASGWKTGRRLDWPRPPLGRVLFNELLPKGYPFVDDADAQEGPGAIVNDLAERYPMIVVAQTVDKLKDAGFYWATRSGVTVAMADVLGPPQKQEILERYERARPTRSRSSTSAAQLNQGRAQRGELVKIWQQATEEGRQGAGERTTPRTNPIITIVKSGADGQPDPDPHAGGHERSGDQPEG